MCPKTEISNMNFIKCCMHRRHIAVHTVNDTQIPFSECWLEIALVPKSTPPMYAWYWSLVFHSKCDCISTRKRHRISCNLLKIFIKFLRYYQDYVILSPMLVCVFTFPDSNQHIHTKFQIHHQIKQFQTWFGDAYSCRYIYLGWNRNGALSIRAQI